MSIIKERKKIGVKYGKRKPEKRIFNSKNDLFFTLLKISQASMIEIANATGTEINA